MRDYHQRLAVATCHASDTARHRLLRNILLPITVISTVDPRTVEHANFFESRATEYSRASTTKMWEEAFADPDPTSAGTVLVEE